MMAVLNVFLMTIMAACNVVSTIVFFSAGAWPLGLLTACLFGVCIWLAWQGIEEDF